MALKRAFTTLIDTAKGVVIKNFYGAPPDSILHPAACISMCISPKGFPSKRPCLNHMNSNRQAEIRIDSFEKVYEKKECIKGAFNSAERI